MSLPNDTPSYEGTPTHHVKEDNMPAGNIFVTITRPGKEAKTVEVAAGSTVEAALVKAEFTPADYNGWSITDEDGDTLGLTDTLDNSTQLVAGQRVAGAA